MHAYKIVCLSLHMPQTSANIISKPPTSAPRLLPFPCRKMKDSGRKWRSLRFCKLIHKSISQLVTPNAQYHIIYVIRVVYIQYSISTTKNYCPAGNESISHQTGKGESSSTQKCRHKRGYLFGGFNPFEKNQSNWIISPGRDENKNHWNHHLGICDRSQETIHISSRIPAFQAHAAAAIRHWKVCICLHNHHGKIEGLMSKWICAINKYIYIYNNIYIYIQMFVLYREKMYCKNWMLYKHLLYVVGMLSNLDYRIVEYIYIYNYIYVLACPPSQQQWQTKIYRDRDPLLKIKKYSWCLVVTVTGQRVATPTPPKKKQE